MQGFPPTGPRNPAGHTDAEIRAALRGTTGARRFSYRFELLDSALNVINPSIQGVSSCKVTHNWLADIKRTAEFTIRDYGEINFLSDRLKPYVRLMVPPYGPEDWVEWPQGVFLLSTPQRQGDPQGVVTRAVTGYDALQVYADDLIATRQTVAAGGFYTGAINDLLGSVPKNLTVSSSTLPTGKEWEPGTSKLRVINDLLSAINYDSLAFNEEGVAEVRPYRDLSSRPEEWIYDVTTVGLIVPTVVQDLDLFSIPNRWVLVVSDPDRAALTSTFTNTDPASATSTVRRQRTITDFRTEQDAADQATLDAKVQRLAREASQVYETIEFETALIPAHSIRDVYRVTYPDLAINAKYAEHAWEINLPARGRPTMKHTARRVVTI